MFCGEYNIINNGMDLCRLCLAKDQTLRPVFDPLQESSVESEIIGKIATCLSVQIQKEDIFSKQICEECVAKIEEFHEFRNRTAFVQRLLENFIKTEDCSESEVAAPDRPDNLPRVSPTACSTSNDNILQVILDVENESTSSEDTELDGEENHVSAEDNDEIEESVEDTADSIDITPENPVQQNDISCVEKSSTSELNPQEESQDEENNVRNPTVLHQNKKQSENSPKTVVKKKVSTIVRDKTKQLKSKQYVCDLYNKEFQTSDELFKNSSNHIKKYACGECPYESKSASNFKIHMLKHNGEFVVVCNVCGKGYYNTMYFKEHFLNYHSIEINVHKCNVCSKIFRSQSYLKLHEKCHMTNFVKRDYQCEMCGQIFQTYRGLKSHILTIHEGSRYKCDKCGKEVMSLQSLKNHKLSHDEDDGKCRKSYVCDICGKGFIARYNLVVHQRIHNGNRPFKCEQCDKSFAQKCTLDNHIKIIHNGEKPFQCTVCNKRFVNKSILRYHTKKHT